LSDFNRKLESYEEVDGSDTLLLNKLIKDGNDFKLKPLNERECNACGNSINLCMCLKFTGNPTYEDEHIEAYDPSIGELC
jgi:hypothetical protein